MSVKAASAMVRSSAHFLSQLTGSVGVVSGVLPVHLVLRALAVFIRMNHAEVLEGDGHWRHSGVREPWRSATFDSTPPGFTRLLPLLSPLNFFSSRRSWSSNSRSNCICSICASIRSLLVSQSSSDSNTSAVELRDQRKTRQRSPDIKASVPVQGPLWAGPSRGASTLRLRDQDSLGQ